MTSPLQTTRIAIIGLGLMGGSLALALKPHCREVIAFDSDSETCDFARERQIVDDIAPDFPTAVATADLLILATPVRTILQLLRELHHLPIRSPLPVMDLGSTKGDIIQAMTLLPEHYDPIGGHPMCGKEVAGIRHAEASMLQGARFVLSPLRRTSAATQELAESLVQAIGARLLILGAAHHDRIVSVTSHLPYLVACGAVATTQDVASRDPMVATLCASGFRDTTRVASSDVEMMVDILYTNRHYVRLALEQNRKIIQELEHLMEHAPQDPEALRSYLTAIQAHRARLLAP